MATPSTVLPSPIRRSDSDISPKTIQPPSGSKEEYFPSDATIDGSGTSVRASGSDGDNSSGHKSSISFAPDLAAARSSSLESTDTNVNESAFILDRKGSVSSVTFRRPRNPSLPQGDPHHMCGSRIRASSPPHER
ncbi:hypothetical protein BGZ63DRAFT_427826 [Mariannaea sp. PMI_226]|nr:hypothetical protein BGZ63DRAFT_427826 [Mariannaea sp. PMI_226]